MSVLSKIRNTLANIGSKKNKGQEMPPMQAPPVAGGAPMPAQAPAPAPAMMEPAPQISGLGDSAPSIGEVEASDDLALPGA